MPDEVAAQFIINPLTGIGMIDDLKLTSARPSFSPPQGQYWAASSFNLQYVQRHVSRANLVTSESLFYGAAAGLTIVPDIK
ncbi:hypothetical protein RI367_008519 [Sorochytrium milnesiophthora]